MAKKLIITCYVAVGFKRLFLRLHPDMSFLDLDKGGELAYVANTIT